MTYKLNYELDRLSEYKLIRILLNDEVVLVQPENISKEFKELGFLNEDEILKDLPGYVKTLQEKGLSIKSGQLEEDEWSKRTEYTMDFHAYVNGEKVATMSHDIYTRIGSYAGGRYSRILNEVDRFEKDLDRLVAKNIVSVTREEHPRFKELGLLIKMTSGVNYYISEEEFKKKGIPYTISKEH